MKTPRRATPRVIGWTAVGVLGLAVVAGTAEAGTLTSGNSTLANAAVSAAAVTTPTDPATPAPAGKAGKAHREGRLGAGRGLHGEFTVKGKDGGYQVVDAQRGTIKAVGDGSVTVTSVDGFEARYVVTADTKIRKGKATSAVGDLKIGDEVVVGAVKGPEGALTAKAIGVPDPNAKAGKHGRSDPSTPSPAPATPAQPGMYSTGSA